MPQFATRLEAMVPAEASQLLSQAKEMQRQGKNIIPLCVGEPDFDTHVVAKKAAKDAIDAGETKYAPLAGIHELRQAICEKLKRDNGIDYTVDNVIAGTGGKQVIFNALMATLNQGDEVIVPAPYWAGYPDVIRLCGGVPIFVETSEVDDYILQPKTLVAIITPRTKWMILNSPSNPTGAVYERADLESLAEVLRHYPDIWIMADDIYEHVVFDGHEFVTLAEVAPDLKDRILIVNGCSKGYAMTGWRIGYGAANAELIRRMTTIQSQVTLSPSTISQWTAVKALNDNLSFNDEQIDVLKARRDLAVSMLNDANGLSCNRPKGAFYIYVNCGKSLGKVAPNGSVIETDRDLCRYFLEEAEVAVMPGSAYGLSPYFRVSYAISTTELEEACMRIQAACAALTHA
jgi:aspartate aminotransferase